MCLEDGIISLFRLPQSSQRDDVYRPHLCGSLAPFKNLGNLVRLTTHLEAGIVDTSLSKRGAKLSTAQ